MNFYLEVLLFAGVMAILVPFILFITKTVSSPFLSMMQTSNSPFYQSANAVSTTGANALNYSFVVIVLVVIVIGIATDIYASIKFPNPVLGFGNIFGVFVLVAVWLILNNVIASSNLLAVFGSPDSLMYQLFASSYLITSLCAAMLVSASFHLSKQRDKRVI